MKVRLWQDIDTLGKRGEIVDVRDGYARNFLIPRRMAAKPSPTLDKEFALEKRRQAKIDAQLIADAKTVAEKLATVPGVVIEVNTHEEGQLYGSVTPTMIAEALKDHGLKVEPKSVEIKDPIKQVGEYQVAINLHREVKPALKVTVVASATAAQKDEAKG